jgi:hypothetical protein
MFCAGREVTVHIPKTSVSLDTIMYELTAVLVHISMYLMQKNTIIASYVSDVQQ